MAECVNMRLAFLDIPAEVGGGGGGGAVAVACAAATAAGSGGCSRVCMCNIGLSLPTWLSERHITACTVL